MEIDLYISPTIFFKSLTGGKPYIVGPELVLRVGDEKVALPLSELFEVWDDYQTKLKDKDNA
jgi:hypothetical protein